MKRLKPDDSRRNIDKADDERGGERDKEKDTPREITKDIENSAIEERDKLGIAEIREMAEIIETIETIEMLKIREILGITGKPRTMEVEMTTLSLVVARDLTVTWVVMI